MNTGAAAPSSHSPAQLRTPDYPPEEDTDREQDITNPTTRISLSITF